jgi:PA domain
VPFGDSNSFLQEFPIAVTATIGPSNALQIDGDDQQVGSDFVTLPLSASGTYDGAMVFSGCGISAPHLGWNDYAGIDVEGKAVVVFAHYPTSPFLAVRALGSLSSFEMKVRTAKAHGARAILFVRDPSFREASLTGINTGPILPHDLGLPAMYVSTRSIERSFRTMGTTIDDVKRSIDTVLRPMSFGLADSSISIVTNVRRVTKTARNVVAAIPGADARLRHDWLIIGAHYDHLGHGGDHGATPR